MKTKIHKIVSLFFLLFLSISSTLFSQTATPPVESDDDDDDENMFNIGAIKNPYESMMETAMGNSFSSGLADISNLEKAMSESAGTVDTSTKYKDQILKYDVVVNQNLDINNFLHKGIWKIAYKEKFDDNRIVPFHKYYDQKVCLNDTILVASDYFYGTTTCLNNLVFFENTEFKKERQSLIGAMRFEDVEKDAKKIIKGLNKTIPLSIDSSGSTNQTFIAALYERFGVDEMYSLSITGFKLRKKIPVKFYIVNENLMFVFAYATIFYLERIDMPEKKINYDLPVEENFVKIGWKKDLNGNVIITGKNLNDFNLFIDEDPEMIAKNGKNKNPKSPKLHITFYPPLVGDNNLSISNMLLDPKTQNLSDLELYNSGGPIHSVKQIYIPLENVNSNLYTINFFSSEAKKYSWGMKYRITYK